MDGSDRELDLYSSEAPRVQPKEPEAPTSVPDELDLYEGVPQSAATASRLLDRPRETDRDTFKRAGEAASEGRTPDWFESLWALFPAGLRDRYRPLGVIGEGGMGVVIEAHDRHLNRTVAIKGLRDPGGLTAEHRARQAGEARITARLSHPNILPVYDLWRDARGNPWCSMMRVPDASRRARESGECAPALPSADRAPTMSRELRELARCGTMERRPLSRLLQTFNEVCRAIAHAHRQGIIHRDLKPENIFIGPAGEALVADWGVALDRNDPAAAAPSLVGTPGYAAPEQLGAFGRPWADKRSDVYSLGVILFELVVGRRFTDVPTIDSDRLVRRMPHAEEAVIPDRAPRELAAIIHKASNPEPTQRYADVDQLIEAVDTYQMGGLLEGLSYTPRERLWKWGRHHPATAAGIALLVLATLGVLIAISLLHFHQKREAERYSRALADANYHFAELYAEKAAAAAERHAMDRAAHYAALALEKCPPGRSLPTARAYTVAARLGGGGRLLWTLAAQGPQFAAAFAPDGRTVAHAGQDGVVHLRDVETQAEKGRLSGQPGWVGSLAFLEGGGLASAGEDGVVRVWDVRAGRVSKALAGHRGPVLSLAAAGPGRLISGGADATLRCWDLATGKELWRQEQPVAGLNALDVDASSGRLAVAGGDRSVPFRDLTTGELRSSIADTSAPARIARFSPDGGILALGGCPDSEGRQVLLWDVGKWQVTGVLSGHGGPVAALAFAPNGCTLATGGDDMTVRVWNLLAREEVLRLEGHSDAVNGLAFSPDGQLLASASQDGTLRLWDMRSGPAVEGRIPLDREVKEVAFQPAGEHFALLDKTGKIRLWDLQSRREVAATTAGVEAEQGLAFEPSGRRLLFESAGGRVQAWDLQSRVVSDLLDAPRNRSCSMRPMPGGKLRVATLRLGRVRWQEVGAGERELEVGAGEALTAVALCPKGRFVAAAEEGRGVRLWNGETGSELGRIEGKIEGLDMLIFSPDSKLLVRVGGSRAFDIWEMTSGRAAGRMLEAHSSRILAAAFSPDGRLLATGSKDGEIVIWDATRLLADGERAVRARLKAGDRAVASLAFSPDARWLVSGLHDPSLVLWQIGSLSDPVELLKQVEEVSPFELLGVELVVNGRAVPAAARFPPDHPFRWTAAAGRGEIPAMLRAGMLLGGLWRGGEDLPRGWGAEAKRWLVRAGREDLAAGVGR